MASNIGQLASDGPSVKSFTSGGYQLFLPPTPFAQQPPGVPVEPNTKPARLARFVMLDDENDTFYDVDYETRLLGNTVPWIDLALHTYTDVAIVFEPRQWTFHEQIDHILATGYLVSIISRTPEKITCKKLGRVNVKPIPEKFMNWHVLEDQKGAELAAELRAGLFRHLWDRRPGQTLQPIQYVTPRSILEAMRSPFHRDGRQLNWQMDHMFAGGQRIEGEQKWKLFV